MYASLEEICINDPQPFFKQFNGGGGEGGGNNSNNNGPLRKNGPVHIAFPFHSNSANNSNGGLYNSTVSPFPPTSFKSPGPLPHTDIMSSVSAASPMNQQQMQSYYPSQSPSPPPNYAHHISPSPPSSYHYQLQQMNCSGSIQHIKDCIGCKKILNSIQEGPDKTTTEDIFEIVSFVSTGLFFLYILDTFVTIRR
jgi:hypothetical protein